MALPATASDWTSYLSEIRSKAKTGDPSAQGILAIFIEMNAATGSYAEALSLARTSAANGDAFGCHALARLHKSDRGVVQKDTERAKALFGKSLPTIEKKAKDGDALCQFLLGDGYYWNHYGKGSLKRAKDWTDKSAAQGFIPARHNQAMLLGSDDETRSNALYLAAAGAGYPPSQQYLQIRAGLIGPASEEATWRAKYESNMTADVQSAEKQDFELAAQNGPTPSNASQSADALLKSGGSPEGGYSTASNSFGENKSKFSQQTFAKVKPTTDQASRLKQALESLFKDNSSPLLKEVIDQNIENDWGPDGQSILCVRPSLIRDGDVKHLPFGYSQLWWPERGLLAQFTRIGVTRNSSTGTSAPYEFEILKEEGLDKVKFESFNRFFYGLRKRILCFKEGVVDLGELDYALGKCIEWGKELTGNQEMEGSPFIKRINDENKNPTNFAFAWQYTSDPTPIPITLYITAKNYEPTPLTVAGVRETSVGPVSYVASGSVSDLENIREAVRYVAYLEDNLREHTAKAWNKVNEKRSVIDSLD
jgi:hypothetical protein